jgi:hypothetical protein
MWSEAEALSEYGVVPESINYLFITTAWLLARSRGMLESTSSACARTPVPSHRVMLQLQEMLTTLGYDCTPEETIEMLRQVDVDSGSKLSFEGFVRLTQEATIFNPATESS